MDYIILLLAVAGLAISLLMKFSKAAQNAFRLNDPSANKKYTTYKTNFLIVVSALIIVFEGLGMVYPGLKGKYNGALAGVLFAAILVDAFAKRKMRK